MARRRRKYNITGDEYTFGGGAASGVTSDSTETLRIAKGNPYTNNASFDGFLKDGDTVTVKLDVSTAVATKDQYVYFDNAFETNTGQFELTYEDGATATPAGITYQNNNDTVDADTGYFRFYGTPTTAGTSKFKVRYFDNAGTEATIYYNMTRFPAGTTPVWSSTTLPDRIVRNLAGAQVLAEGPTTTQTDPAPYYSLKDVSGFATGATPVVDSATGEVTVNNVGDIQQAASSHSFTVVADLGSEVGEFEQTFTGNISYGDAYGARYFGPANASANLTSSQTYATVALSEAICNPKKSSGALRRIYSAQHDTSPYEINDGYGCNWYSSIQSYVNQTTYDDVTSAYIKNGVMGFPSGSSLIWQSTANHQVIRFRWQVPNGVTSISMVAVGGGGPGMYTWASHGGGGGGLAWLNGVSVTAGQEFEICVGLGRYSESSQSSYGAGPSWVRDVTSGDFLVYGQGGGWNGHQSASPNNQSTSYTGGVTVQGIDQWTSNYNYNNSKDGGGWGVNSNYGTSVEGFHYGGGSGHYCNTYNGGGAGGYRGNNGQGSSSAAGNYGGGGAGNYYSSTYGASAGGGVGLDGQGQRGSQIDTNPSVGSQAGSGYGGNSGSWTSYSSGSSNYRGGGGGGSGGSRGSYAENSNGNTQGESTGNRTTPGGHHGGGGGGSGTSWGGGHGAPGGVRIIWGVGDDGTERCFPYNYASENPSRKVAGIV